MLRENLSESLKEATLAKDSCATATIRLILAALKDRDIAARSKGNSAGISDDDILGLLQTMVKQRRESIEMYEQGNRQELADREAREIDVIQRFLPAQMDEHGIADAVAQAIEETGAAGLKDMGKVMGALRAKFAGQMDFSKASATAKQKLS